MIVLDVVLSKMSTALQYLNPTNVDLADYTDKEKQKPEILLRVVTDNFKDVRTQTRDRMVRETLAKYEPEIYDRFSIVCQCLTEREYRLYQMGKYWIH